MKKLLLLSTLLVSPACCAETPEKPMIPLACISRYVWVGIGPDGAQHLAAALQSNSTLTLLDLRINYVDVALNRKIEELTDLNKENEKSRSLTLFGLLWRPVVDAPDKQPPKRDWQG